jgi:hypothetical protein
MASPLWNLDFGQIGAGLKRLGDRGVDVQDWLRLLADDKTADRVTGGFKFTRDYSNVFEFVGTVTQKASVGDFRAQTFFVLNDKDNGLPRISSMDDNFVNLFGKKIERPIPDATLHRYKCLERMDDLTVIAAFGGKEKIETSLTELFCLLVAQKNGEDGDLLIDGSSNGFYVKTIKGGMEGISVSWEDGGWNIGFGLMEEGCEWDPGTQVFSPNKIVESSNP